MFIISAFSLTLISDLKTSNQPEMRLQFAAVIERRFQCRLKPEIEGRSNIGCDSSDRKRSKSLFGLKGIPLRALRDSLENPRFLSRNASTWTSLKLLQIYDVQLDQRNLLHFVLSPGAEFPSSPGPGAYLSRLPKCAY